MRSSLYGEWASLQQVGAQTYVCGFCGDKVSSKERYRVLTSYGNQLISEIRICPSCNRPTLFESGRCFPASAPGNPVDKVPNEISTLYDEARSSTAAGASTAAVLVCRKILMHIAVEKGAKEGDSFVSYIEYLANAGYVPPDGKGWVDYIRQKGNEANHEIKLMREEDAIALISFVEMLLRFIYEFPSKIPLKPLPSSGGGAPRNP